MERQKHEECALVLPCLWLWHIIRGFDLTIEMDVLGSLSYATCIECRMSMRNTDVGVIHAGNQSGRHTHWKIGSWTIISWQERRSAEMIWLIHGWLYLDLAGLWIWSMVELKVVYRYR